MQVSQKKTPQANLLDSELKEGLTDLQVDELLVVLDCCDAENFDVLPARCAGSHKNHYSVVWPSCSITEKSKGGHSGSRFTKYMVAGLRSADISCNLTKPDAECTDCWKYRRDCLLNSTLQVSKLQAYVHKHVKQNVEQRSVVCGRYHEEIDLVYTNDPDSLSHTLWFNADNSNKYPVDLMNFGRDIYEVRREMYESMKSELKVVPVVVFHSKLRC